MKLLIRICAEIFCLIALGHSVAAQNILPSSFGGWTASAPSAAIPVSGLEQLLGANAAAFREYIVKSVEQRAYAQGDQTASVMLYRLRDPSSAYGAYTFLQNDSLSSANLGSFGGTSHDRALFVVGEMLVDVSAGPKQSRPTDADLEQLARQLAKVADRAPYPTIAEQLPAEGRVRGTVHYVLGPRSLAQYVPLGTEDWMGFDHSAEAILGQYQVSPGKDEILIVTSYPTQQIAAAEFAAMLRRFQFDPPGDVPANQNVLFGKRVSSLVAVVVGAPSRQAANKLLDQIGYETEVTWNEPKQTLTEPTINTMIVGAFMGTGAVMILAVAAGIGFGGIRVLVKLFFPNKVFDRDKQVEILQLGISSKPINAKDFY